MLGSEGAGQNPRTCLYHCVTRKHRHRHTGTDTGTQAPYFSLFPLSPSLLFLTHTHPPASWQDLSVSVCWSGWRCAAWEDGHVRHCEPGLGRFHALGAETPRCVSGSLPFSSADSNSHTQCSQSRHASLFKLKLLRSFLFLWFSLTPFMLPLSIHFVVSFLLQARRSRRSQPKSPRRGC